MLTEQTDIVEVLDPVAGRRVRMNERQASGTSKQSHCEFTEVISEK